MDDVNKAVTTYEHAEYRANDKLYRIKIFTLE